MREYTCTRNNILPRKVSMSERHLNHTVPIYFAKKGFEQDSYKTTIQIRKVIGTT